MRPSPETEIYAPEFPAGLEWVNVAVPAHEHAAGAGSRASRVLGLRAGELAAHDAVPEGLARALRGCGPEGDRRSTRRATRSAATATPSSGRSSGSTWLPGAARSRARGVARVREHRLARALPVRPHRQARVHPLRRGRVPGDGARDPGMPSGESARAARAPSARRTPPACCSSRRPPTSRCPRTASGSSWCATGRTATTGSRPPTPARRRSSASAPAARTPCCPARDVEPGLYEVDGTRRGRRRPACGCMACSSRLRRQLPADLLREHEADVLLDDLELGDVLVPRARKKSTSR